MTHHIDTPAALHAVLQRLAAQLQQRGWMLTTAESCTGGLIAAACTELAGSSAWFDRGFVTYSNTAKTEMLGVPADLIATHGAVSAPVAHAMCAGALARSNARVALSVTGIAGPSGGSLEKPVGTVWFGWAMGDQVRTASIQWTGNRQAVREQTQLHALLQLSEWIGSTFILHSS